MTDVLNGVTPDAVDHFSEEEFCAVIESIEAAKRELDWYLSARGDRGLLRTRVRQRRDRIAEALDCLRRGYAPGHMPSESDRLALGEERLRKSRSPPSRRIRLPGDALRLQVVPQLVELIALVAEGEGLQQVQAGVRREVPEVAVARDQRHAVIDARLCNEGVGQACAQTLGENPRAGLGGALPEAGPDVEHGQASEEIGGLAVEVGRTQDFGEDDRWEDRLLKRESLIEPVHVATLVAREEGD